MDDVSASLEDESGPKDDSELLEELICDPFEMKSVAMYESHRSFTLTARKLERMTKATGTHRHKWLTNSEMVDSMRGEY